MSVCIPAKSSENFWPDGILHMGELHRELVEAVAQFIALLGDCCACEEQWAVADGLTLVSAGQTAPRHAQNTPDLFWGFCPSSQWCVSTIGAWVCVCNGWCSGCSDSEVRPPKGAWIRKPFQLLTLAFLAINVFSKSVSNRLQGFCDYLIWTVWGQRPRTMFKSNNHKNPRCLLANNQKVWPFGVWHHTAKHQFQDQNFWVSLWYWFSSKHHDKNGNFSDCVCARNFEGMGQNWCLSKMFLDIHIKIAKFHIFNHSKEIFLYGFMLIGWWDCGKKREKLFIKPSNWNQRLKLSILMLICS